MSHTATAVPSAIPQAARTSEEREKEKERVTGVLRTPTDVFDLEFGANAFGTVVLLAWKTRKGGVEIGERVGSGEEEQNRLVGGACSHNVGFVGIVVDRGDRTGGFVAVNVVYRGRGHVEKLRERRGEDTP